MNKKCILMKNIAMKTFIGSFLCFAMVALFLPSCTKDKYKADPYTLQQVRLLYTGKPLELPESKIIGVVISDANSKNIPAGLIVVQDNNRGIALSVGAEAAASLSKGDSIRVDATGGSLTREDGILQVKNIDKNKIQKLASNSVVKPIQLTYADFMANALNYESTLVQVTASTEPAPVQGDVFKGDKLLSDNMGKTIVMHTEANATFAEVPLPVNATFTGIAFATPDASPQLWVRNVDDVQHSSGAMYANYPEQFENGTKKSYTPAVNVTLPSGSWRLDNAVMQNESKDKPTNGVYAVRMQQNLTVSAYLQMMYNVPSASKVTVWYGVFTDDLGCTWRLEYSTNNGTSWTAAGPDVKDASPRDRKLAVFTFNIKVPVRFRINKIGLGTTNSSAKPPIINGRLNIDDFAIYQ